MKAMCITKAPNDKCLKVSRRCFGDDEPDRPGVQKGGVCGFMRPAWDYQGEMDTSRGQYANR